MNREMIEKVVKAMMKYETVEIELLGLTEDERAKELAEFIEKDIEEQKKKELENLLVDFNDVILDVDSWYEIEDKGEWRKATGDDRLNEVQMQWQALRYLLYVRFGIDTYKEEWEKEAYLND